MYVISANFSEFVWYLFICAFYKETMYGIS